MNTWKLIYRDLVNGGINNDLIMGNTISIDQKHSHILWIDGKMQAWSGREYIKAELTTRDVRKNCSSTSTVDYDRRFIPPEYRNDYETFPKPSPDRPDWLKNWWETPLPM